MAAERSPDLPGLRRPRRGGSDDNPMPHAECRRPHRHSRTPERDHPGHFAHAPAHPGERCVRSGAYIGIGRDGRVRTCGLMSPRHARYQAALRPECHLRDGATSRHHDPERCRRESNPRRPSQGRSRKSALVLAARRRAAASRGTRQLISWPADIRPRAAQELYGLVEPRGIEPLTSCMPCWRSPG